MFRRVDNGVVITLTSVTGEKTIHEIIADCWDMKPWKTV